MTLLQDAVGKLSMTANPDGEKAAADPKAKAKAKATPKAAPAEDPADSPAVLSGLHPKSPACNFKDAFQLFVDAEKESPEIRYKGQIAAMGNMGFTDKEMCIQALHSCDGNMNKAVEFLMSKQQ